jgi:quinol monooxygenase YgiN
MIIMTQTPPTPSIDEIRAQVSRMLDSLAPDTPIAATVLFQVNPPQESTFLSNIEELKVATLKLPGVREFGYHKLIPILPNPSPSDPPEYLIYEDWETRDYFRPQWDSVHLVKFQFSLNPLVVAPPDLNFYFGSEKVSARAHVLRTGQTRCWDSEGSHIACACTGQDGDIQAGVPSPSPRFTDLGNGTVTDNLTGLFWLRNANRFNEVPWAQALTECQKLAGGSHGLSDGSQPGDWRLPNVDELLSLVNLDNTSGPPIPHVNPFTGLQPANYWSSSSVSSAPALGWYVAMAVGPHVFDLKVNSMRVWPVRGAGSGRVARTGQTKCYDSFGNPISCSGSGQDADILAGVPFPTPRFTDHGDGTVTDRLTGLIWLKNASAFCSMSWDLALKHCNNLASGSPNSGLTDGSKAGDWHLPNVNELRSLVDFDQAAPPLPLGHPFVNVRPTLYWSSTTVASAPNQARFLFMGLPSAVWDHKSVQMMVWPVRGRR